MADGGCVADITLTLFYSYSATRRTERRYTWPQLHAEILATSKPRKETLPWLKLARFGDVKTTKGSLRHDANVLAITGIEADYDGEIITPAEAVEKLEKAGIRSLVYTSPSHTEDAPRWRVLCPTSTELPPDRRAHLVGRLNGLFGGILAAESFTLSQSYYFGSIDSNPSHMAELIDGQPIDLCDELDAIWIGRSTTKAVQGNDRLRHGKVDMAGMFAAIVSRARYHEATVRMAGAWAHGGVPQCEALQRLDAAFDAVAEELRDTRWITRRDDVQRCVEDIYAKEARQQVARATLGEAITATSATKIIWPEPIDFLASDEMTGLPVLAAPHIPAPIYDFAVDTAERMGVDTDWCRAVRPCRVRQHHVREMASAAQAARCDMDRGSQDLGRDRR